ncbi:hypothetical protein Rleg4DRAFT_2180 [Rhizobium leguminosarum bv. trifolii WSM2297]|uniref:Uncharacterized protein n=1 Tax=Rhizobium leguminosarum bv. trifolii WSM2297 TaxID=754762 RepID=J0KSK1_RHILT|nr:hypothetical protein [Rhizobium leguminosarum]EJC80549.1 hypothetical protein Rleg4DRAFT_2180 [Rhizobium leguminosarum bv. trifolii WSM2297]
MKTIAGSLIAYLFFLGIGYVFTGELYWFACLGVFSFGLERLFIWLFVDPDYGKRRDRPTGHPGKLSPDQNSPSI